MKTYLFAFCLFVLFFTARSVLADQDAEVRAKAGVNFTNAYYHRGILQEDQGFIAQPYLETAFPLDGQAILNLSVWNSLHGEQTGADGGPDSWYESRLSAGVSHPIDQHLDGSVAYTIYTSPSGAFDEVHEVSLRMDHDHWLNPHALLAVEVDGSRSGPDEGVYLEAGVRPGVMLFDGGLKACLSVPVVVGVGLHNYYQNVTGGITVGGDSVYEGGYEQEPDRRVRVDDPASGFVSAGGELTAPVGSWLAKVGVHHLWLFDTTKAANGGDGTEWLFTAGVGVGF